MKKSLLIIATIVLAGFTGTTPRHRISGFTWASSGAEYKLEARYDSLLRTEDVDYFIKYLSAKPHQLGSANDKANKEFILQKYKEWGYDAHIDTFYALFPTPKTRVLEASGIDYKASLQEPALKEDATSRQTSEQLPTYNAYSADGDVTAELIYVNQGIPADYEELEKMGVSVKGKIVIARYGGAWRGIKPKLAYEHGAIGCIIYSDPKDDGYYQGDVYPTGAFRNENGVQRGSVLDIPLYPGDPLTPGYGATKNAKRLDKSMAANLLKIPVLPISYHDAKPLLAALKGAVVPENWRGALPLTYHVGPGNFKVHLKLEFNWNTVPVYDVIAMLKGSVAPDQWVIRGNHEDAWVNGASDPISGQAAMLTQAKAIGQLAKAGFRPKRTLVFCSWDGEEEGLLGSTEWVEQHATELQQKCVAYINSDGNGRGFFGAGGSHTLQAMVNEAAANVTDPEMGINVLERRIAHDVDGTGDIKKKKELLASKTIKIDALGSGSDFSSFLQHIGVPTLDLSFGGENDGGEYHSIYDSYDMYRRFKDPGFKYGVALAKTAGHIMFRLANADVLPFNFNDFCNTLNEYVKEVMQKLDEMRTATEVNNQVIRTKYDVYASDPTKTYVPPATKASVPYLDFSPLQNALASLKAAAVLYETVESTYINEYDSAMGKHASLKDTSLNHLNTLIYKNEQALLLANGLPDRPWYKHSIYAPGYYLGYGVETLPGVREAIENRKWQLASQQIVEAAKTIKAYTTGLEAAIQTLHVKMGRQ